MENEQNTLNIDSIPKDSQQSEEIDSKNILQVMESLQDQINTLKSQNKTYESQLNQFRLGMFIPSNLHDVDVAPYASRCTFSFLTVLKSENGYDQALAIKKCLYEIASRCTELMEEYQSKRTIKIDIEKKDKAAKANVEKIRAETSPEAKQKKFMLTKAEKAVKGVLKAYAGVKMTNAQLVPIVKAYLPGETDESVLAILETFYAKISGVKK